MESATLSKAFVIARSRTAQKAVRCVNGRSLLLPCPSLFAAARENPSRALRSVAVLTGYIGKSDHCSAGSALFALLTGLNKRYDVRILCTDISGFFAFAERWPARVFFCPTLEAELQHMSACDGVLSTDEIGAFVAQSVLKPGIVIGTGDGLSPAAELFPYLLTARPENALDQLRQLDIDALARDLLNWKRRVEHQYLAALCEWFRAHDLHLV